MGITAAQEKGVLAESLMRTCILQRLLHHTFILESVPLGSSLFLAFSLSRVLEFPLFSLPLLYSSCVGLAPFFLMLASLSLSFAGTCVPKYQTIFSLCSTQLFCDQTSHDSCLHVRK